MECALLRAPQATESSPDVSTPSPAASGTNPRRSATLPTLLVFVATLAALWGFARAYEIPVPEVHDEFGYLLTADTFASGRITNPTHPFAPHFETFHIFHEPTYQAKFPPGQGAFLALGTLLGEPIYGVWLCIALALAATTWMLAATMPSRWAVLGAALLLFDADIFTSWGESYWGGGVAMLGGALLFGGAARLGTRVSAVDSGLMGLGVLLLANSRPLEGGVATVLAVIAMLSRIGTWSRGVPARTLVGRWLVPLGIGATLAVGWTLYYNHVVGGDAFRMVYKNWRPVLLHHPNVRNYHGSANLGMLGEIKRMASFFLSGPLVLALPFLVVRLRAGRSLGALAIVSMLGALSLVASRAWPHYVAPIACLIALLVVEALRGLAGLRLRGQPVGALAAAALIVAHLGLGVYELGNQIRWGPGVRWKHHRQRILEELEATGSKHLVFVRPAPDANYHQDWVFNRADIDGAAVVWAREIEPASDARLLRHFADRQVWLLHVPADEPKLVPYPR